MALIENRKAYFDFEILEKFEAGLELKGCEVKALKNGGVFGRFAGNNKRRGSIYRGDGHTRPISPQTPLEIMTPNATRRLLLRKKEIQYLSGKYQEKGLTLVPLGVYAKKGFFETFFRPCQRAQEIRQTASH